MKLGLSGSTIKSWFQYRCERKTRYELMMPQDRAGVPISDDGREKSWAVLGVDFEKRVMARLTKAHAVLAPGANAESLREDLATAFMRGEGDASFAAQVNLRPSKTGDLLTNENLTLRRTFADLVRRDAIGQQNRFTVIDIKATRNPRAFHKTQVAYYALLLRAILAERGIQGEVSPFGEIWYIPSDGDTQGDLHSVDRFDLGPYLRLVEDFMKVGLPEIASREVSAKHDETFFHLYFKCEQCSYLAHCQRSIDRSLPAAQRDVSAVPGLSHESKRMLRQHGIDTVGKLAHGARGVGRLDGANWSLARKAEQLIVRANAIEQGLILNGVEEQTFLMPPRSDVILVLLVDHDPVDDGMVSLGYLWAGPSGETETIEIMPTASQQAEADALISVFSKLISDLQAVDLHNSKLDPDDPAALRAHIYFYEPAESRSLQGAIQRHLTDPRVRAGLLHMVRLFPPEDVIPEPEFRGIDHLPATAVRTVVEQLFALPATVSYDLKQVSQALVAGGDFLEPYVPEPSFERPFSSLLSIEISRSLREGKGVVGLVDQVRGDVSQRLRSTLAIVRWLESMHAKRVAEGKAPLLRLTKRPFRFQATFDPIDMADLDALTALELLENRAGMLEALIGLALPAQLRVSRGSAIGPLRLIKASNAKGQYTLTFRRTPSAMSAEIPRGGMGLVLSDGSAESLLDPRRWAQMGCNLLEPRSFDDASLVRVWMREDVYNSPMFNTLRRSVPEDGWWLDQTFFDVNSAKAETYLRYLGEIVS